MIIDTLELADESLIEADVCIIGAGPAGLTVAHELMKDRSLRLCLIESGGLSLEGETEELKALAPVGGDLEPPVEARRRQFGGAANSWNVLTTQAGGGVRYLPLSPLDFEKREWVPYSGWPFSRADLDPFYARAQEICDIGPFTYRADGWATSEAGAWPLDTEEVTTSVEQFGHSSIFTDQHLRAMRETPDLKLLLHANVSSVEKRPGSSAVERAVVSCLNGRHHSVTAKVFVLATGAIENARLLLLSNAQQASGLGNQHDLVGRFFMDHHNVFCGEFVPEAASLFGQAALYDLRRVSGTWIMAKLNVSDSLMRREHLLNSGARIEAKRDERLQKAISFAGQTVRSLRNRTMPSDVLAGLGAFVPQIPHLVVLGGLNLREFVERGFVLPERRGRYGWSRRYAAEHRFASFGVELQVELSPAPGNLVTLGDKRDAFGQRLAGVHWQWQELDLQSLRRTQEILASEFRNAGLGVLKPADLEAKENFLSPAGIFHHMGTTRMHTDPKQGVVDPDCRVHGLENLFVAGSSVFPTGGYANPTLTIVALSIRLADHLANMMRAGKITLS